MGAGRLAGVIGTAGHVDHGKSSLVRALTGVDPDRLPEERARGMSIELGFAPWPRPDGRKVAIVDVPGHERFIRTMAVGASGVDLACLVVAADDGLMPQSREHAAILQLLGVRHAVVALSKVDLAGPELSALAQEELAAWLAEGPWAGAPVVPCSATSGEGLEALAKALDRCLAIALAARPAEAPGPWRLPIDRAFLAQGRGVVVAGPLRVGRVAMGQHLRLEPGARPVRVRGLQSQGQDLEAAEGHGRVALALAGLEGAEGVAEAKGAWLVGEGAPAPSQALLLRLQRAPGVAAWPKRGGVAVLAGAAQAMGRLSWWECEGQTWACLSLDRPVVAWVGDRLLLRRASPDALLGLGEVLHATPGPWRQAKTWGPALALAAKGEWAAAAEAALALAGESGLAAERLGGFWPPAEQTEAKSSCAAWPELGGRHLHPQAWKALAQRVEGVLARSLAERPWVDGVEGPALAEACGLKARRLEGLLLDLAHQGRVLRVGRRWVLPSHQAKVSGPLAEAEAQAIAAFEAQGHLGEGEALALAPPGLAKAWAERVKAWPQAGLAARSAGLWLGEAWVAAQLTALRAHFGEADFSTSEAREALGSTRKLTIPLLELLDGRQATRRQGDRRRLLPPKA